MGTTSGGAMPKTTFYACLLLLVLNGFNVVQAQTPQVVMDAYSNTAVQQGDAVILVCRVVGVPSTTVLSYEWTCPGGYCDAGGVEPEWAARIQQDNILVVNLRRRSVDNGVYTCTVQGNSQQVGTAMYTLSVSNGLSLLNEDGGLRVFFPRNSFVTNTTLTHTNSPRQDGGVVGNDHIVCYGGSIQAQVRWHNSSDGMQLEPCITPCKDCGGRCIRNGAVGVDPQDDEHTDIHMYTDSTAYVNQDLECRVSSVPSALIGVYLKGEESTTLQPSSSITQEATSNTAVSVSWSQVSGATGYYVSYQRQDLGTPPVVTPQYERIVGGATTSVMLSGLEPGTTYRIRVWSTDGTSVSSGAGEMAVTTMESAPTPPRMLTTTGERSGSDVEVNWLPPLHPNGAIHYEIEYQPTMTPGDPVNVGNSSSPYFTLPLPNEFLTYNVRVAAVNTQGQAQSNVIAVCPGQNSQQAPQPPSGIMVTANGCNSAMVSWNAQQSRMCDVVIVSYSVRYRLTGGSGGYNNVSTSSTNVTLEKLVPNAEYDVEVTTVNSNAVMSAYSTVTQLSMQDPTPPTDVLAEATGCDTAMVSWTASTSMFYTTIANYSVRNRLTNGTGDYTTVYTASTSITLQGLVPNAGYNVSVAGINSCGGTSAFEMTQLVYQDPAPPREVTPTVTGCNTVSISWIASQSAFDPMIGNYTVRYQVKNDPGSVMMIPSQTTTASLQNLVPNAEYYVSVAGINSCGGTSAFERAEFTLRDPAPPTGVSVVAGMECGTANVSWNPSMVVYSGAIGNYSVRYRPSGGGDYTTVYSTSTSVTLQGLNRSLEYVVDVTAIDSCGRTSGFSMQAQLSVQDPAPPTGVSVVAGTECGTADVSWNPSNVSSNAAIGTYSVRYRPRSGGDYTTVTSPSTSITLQGLNRSLEYVVDVTAIDSCSSKSGFSMEATLDLQASGPPVGMSVRDGSECYTSVVSWSVPQPVCNVTFVIGNYSVRYKQMNGGSYTTVYSPNTSVTLQGLMANTEYSVSVAAINPNGNLSAFTGPNQFILQEPTPPTGVMFEITGIDTAVVSWTASQSICDGVIGNYSVTYRLSNGTNATVYTNETSITLSGLIPNAEYSVFVAAFNSRGDVSLLSVETPFTVSTPTTPPPTTPPPAAPAPAVNITTIIAAVVVVLAVVVVGIVVALCCGIFCWRRKRKDKLYEPAVTATKATFQPSNTLQYDNMYAEVRETSSQPLNAPVEYSNVDRTVSDYDYAVVPKDLPIPTAVAGGAEEAADEPQSAPIVEHQYAAVKKKSKDGTATVEAMDTVVNPEGSSPHTPPKPHPKPVPPKPAPFSGKAGKGGKSVRNDGAFDGFLKQVESMHAQGKSSFEAEFNSVEKKSASSTSVAELNNAKNRYKNIFPYDSSRVVLSVPNSSGTDYINASFIDGYQTKDSYIASQAPAPGTVDDFWQMIWDQNMVMVIMLTKTMEGTKRKSEDYYPESPGETFSSGRFQIRTLSLKYHVEYEVRVFEVAQTSDPSKTHTLDHYLFTGWPDYGVPKYPTSLIRMLYHVRDARVSDVPLMVHCSAGVGRTGTYIALDITLDQMKAEKKVDVKGTMEKMRERRMNMIQTVDQYMFVYDAVRELLLLGDTTIKASDMRMVISQLKNKDGGSTGYQQQFASLNTLTQESADDEKVEEDPEIIRYLDRSPIKGKHLFVSKSLTGSPVVMNASSVDGYHAPRAFLAAQSPMRTTVDEFWNLIAEKKVQTVLLLCQLMEDSQETCQMFWPAAEGGTMNVGSMKVILLQSTARSEFDTYRFTIQKPRSTQDVTLLHYKQWPEKKRPKSASFLSLFTSAQKLQQPHSDRPIVVACNDGLGRTGTFIAIWSLIEQMKAEGQIDVVGIIKSIRTQRPGAVPHLDQFMYCHDLLLEYVDSFEGYSNFNR